ncbi:unnamed protein product [Rhizophagus irregularis]|nr:unnamed protein product [Rhizophagus irregularis]
MQKETDFLEITNEVASIYTFQSRESKIQDDVSKNHVALSPDGRFAAFFNTENYEIRLYESKDLDECITLIKFNESNLLSPYWSLAISNSINIRGTNDVLIAISCFNDNDIMSGPDENNLKRTQNVIDIETGNDGFTPSMTFVISTRNKSKIPTTIDNIGGVLHFLENHSSTAESDESNGFTNLIIMNVLGITKSKIYHKDNFSLPKSGLFNKIINAEEFYFPSIVAFNILKLYQDVSFEEEIGYHENGKVKFAPVIIIWDLFSYKSNIHKIDIKKIFPMLQGSANYSIAKSSGTIISVTDDEKIFSILHNPIIEALLNRHLRVSENLLKLSFQNIYDHSTDKFKYYHIIFQLDGKWLDARKENNRSIVVNNKEPWVHYKQYRRISAYLDEKKSIQLIIGESTVQVWRKKDRNAKSKRVLEYIWTNPGNQRILIDSLSIGKHEFSLDLKIPSKHNSMSFLGINIHWPQNTHTLKEACEALEFLHNRRNEPVGPKNQNKFESLVHDTEKLVIHIIKKYPNVWKLSEIRFNLMANLIRGHRINLIKRILFENTSLRNNVDCPIYICRNLHVPRLHDLKSSIKKSDLQIAIESSEGAHRKIVAMLLEYYSNNAMQNTGWMFTVSKVIPLLMERNLDIYIKEMFYKPCFGAKEEYLDPIFINQKELKRGYNRSVYALNVKPGLIQKQEQKSWWKKVKSVRPSFKRNKEGKPEELPVTNLRVVPLPDFTVYPEACVVPIISLTTFYTFKTLNLSDNSRVITITFVILLLWFELILLMRFFEKSAHYINMIVNILYGVSTFIIFILLVIIGFGHSMHFLLRHPDYISEKPSGETFETDDDSSFKFKIHQTYDLDTTSDNYYRKLPQSIIAVYFWMLGRWDQLENWNFWPITVLSIIASILLVFIMQNMLIAFMTGVFDETKSNVKQAVLKFRADLIAEYEAIEKPFDRFHKFEDDETDDDDDYIDEIDDDDDFDEKHQKHHYRGDTSISNIEEEELFVNDGKISKSKEKQKLKDCQNNLEEKINDITNRISSVEENLKELIKLVKERK